MGKPSSRPPGLALVAVALIFSISVLESMRPIPSMMLAIVAAVGWCIWLDRHPPLDL